MSSGITLDVGPLTVDWGANDGFENHSSLFREPVRGTVPYYYAEGVVENKPAYITPLPSVRRRLDLLGFSPARLASVFDETEQPIDVYETPEITFDLFREVLASIDISGITERDEVGGWPRLGELVAARLRGLGSDGDLRSLEAWNGTFMDGVHPYLLLRLLLENPGNSNQNVIWRWADVVEGGWVAEEVLWQRLSTEDRYLIVTEGSSDRMVLERALPLVAPDIADFFYFVDATESAFPFTGTGNVVRFSEGLCRIQILNKVVIVLDNDAAGCAAYSKLKALPLPRNVRVMTLPDLPESSTFLTRGPTGEQRMDVNGRAVSIEMFLDHRYGPAEHPVVRWTSYDEGSGRYQGELHRKQEYVQAFIREQPRDPDYDMSKLRLVWDTIYGVCCRDLTLDRGSRRLVK